MPESSEWTEWHLTASGWVRGTTRTDFAVTRRPLPIGRVKTCRYVEEITHVKSGMAVDVQELNVFDVRSAGELEARFGPCPRQL